VSSTAARLRSDADWTPIGEVTAQRISDREAALILASGLAWAVGFIQGTEADPGYAGQVLEWWRSPQIQIKLPDNESEPGE
jgi:hypothetical protein